MSSTTYTPPIKWDCVYCGRALGGFAIATQLVLGYDGIDYCRKCGDKAARARLGRGLLKMTALERGQPPGHRAYEG